MLRSGRRKLSRAIPDNPRAGGGLPRREEAHLQVSQWRTPGGLALRGSPGVAARLRCRPMSTPGVRKAVQEAMNDETAMDVPGVRDGAYAPISRVQALRARDT